MDFKFFGIFWGIFALAPSINGLLVLILEMFLRASTVKQLLRPVLLPRSYLAFGRNLI